MTIDEIVTRSIPLDYNCNEKNAQAKARREKLRKWIEDYTAKQLQNQFNANKVVSDWKDLV